MTLITSAIATYAIQTIAILSIKDVVRDDNS